MITLDKLLTELQHYKRDRQQLQSMYIQQRLEKSLQSYYDQLRKSSYYLTYNNQARRSTILKELTDIND